jgi:hypothetical protein
MRAIESFCQQVNPDQILWGTDYGFSFADCIEYRLNLFLRAKIADSLKETVLSHNPLRLLELV